MGRKLARRPDLTALVWTPPMFEQDFTTVDNALRNEAGCQSELDLEKLPSLIRLKYGGAIADAIAELGAPDEIRRLFAEFQQFLYQGAA